MKICSLHFQVSPEAPNTVLLRKTPRMDSAFVRTLSFHAFSAFLPFTSLPLLTLDFGGLERVQKSKTNVASKAAEEVDEDVKPMKNFSFSFCPNVRRSCSRTLTQDPSVGSCCDETGAV